MPTLYHVTPYKNWKKVKKHGLLPRAGRRGFAADDPDEPRIYLFESPETADDAMTNWLVDEYPEDRFFALIQVEVYGTSRIYDDPEVAGSYFVLTPLAPGQLKLYSKVDAGEPE